MARTLLIGAVEERARRTVGVIERRVEELVPEPDRVSIRLGCLPAPGTRDRAHQRIPHDHPEGVPVERVLGRFATP